MIEEPAKPDSSDDRRLHHRRGFARANAPWPVTIISGSKTLEGRVRNISQGGVLVYLKENLAVHETIRIAVEIPDCSNVLTAEGKVIRATALDTIVDDQYACSAAIQFTNISPQDLKYFSGNLAPEWHRINSAPEQFSQSAQPDNSQDTKSNKSLFLAGAVLCGVVLLFFLISGNNDGQDISEQITAIEVQYNELQTQLKILQDSENKLERIEEEIQRMDIQLIDFQEKLTSLALVMEKAGEERRHTDNERPETENNITVLSNDPPSSKIVVKEPDYYEVKKGQTLYRISVELNTTVSRLRKLNNLNIDDRIYPGQKLRIN